MKTIPRIAAVPVSRRRFCTLAGTVVAAPFLALPRRSLAGTVPRTLALDHTHTGEVVALTYAHGDSYVPEALQALNHFLRDFRTGQAHPIEPRLFDQLHLLATITGGSKPFQVISGYRSPETNRGLRAHSTGVASHSLHLEGQAIDIRLPGVPLATLRDAAFTLKAGGVGYYAASDFVHVDTGRVRRW